MNRYRLIIMFFIMFLLVGCNSNNKNKVNDKDINIKDEVKKEEKIEDKYVDNNPIKLSLYVNKNKIKDFNSPMNIYTDIVSLECYYTEDDRVIDGKFSDVFSNYYSKYTNIDNYKIGYRVKFSTSDGEFDKYIYRPRDVESYFNYIQTYLYDDIHQSSSWYSHLEDNNYTENSRLTSIKFTASTYIDRVTSNIEVTVFTYIDSDINEKGEYMGNSKYTVIIHKS